MGTRRIPWVSIEEYSIASLMKEEIKQPTIEDSIVERKIGPRIHNLMESLIENLAKDNSCNDGDASKIEDI